MDRPTNSTIKIKVGTYADGRDRVEEHHWSNCRPAFVGPNTPMGQRPKLGRPTTSRPAPTTVEPTLTPIISEPRIDEQNPLDDFSNQNTNSAGNFESLNQSPPVALSAAPVK